MLRLARRAAPLGLLLVLFSQSAALAATVNVSMTNFVFTPSNVKTPIGSTVIWTNNSGTPHTSTGDSPLSLWDSGSVGPAQTFQFQFTAAGAYPYHCTFHAGMGMVGTVTVKMKATPASGGAGTMFQIKPASKNAASPFVYEIQMKEPGGSFVHWQTTTAKTVIWDSTGLAPGVYQFRSQLVNTNTGATSGFSPGKKVTITP